MGPDDLEASLLGGLALGGLCGAALVQDPGADGVGPAEPGAGDGAAGTMPGRSAAGLAGESAALLVRVGRMRPDHAHPCTDLAGVLQAARLQRGYEPVLRAALLLAPDDVRLRRAWAELLYDLGRHEAALEAVAAWQSLCPGGRGSGVAAGAGPGRSGGAGAGAAAPAEAEPDGLRAAVLVELGRAKESLEICRGLVARRPDQARHWANLGTTLRRLGRPAEALPAFRRAAGLAPGDSPGDAQIRLNHAVALLQAGRLAEGWREYEARLGLPGHGVLAGHGALAPQRLLPDLARLGADGLRGRTVLCVHEEGLGDTLQFARYLPMLAARGARVVALVPPSLVRLLRGMPGVAVVEQGAAVPAHDWHCPMLSLPRAFGTTLETIPWAGPYLHPPALPGAGGGPAGLPRRGQETPGAAWRCGDGSGAGDDGAPGASGGRMSGGGTSGGGTSGGGRCAGAALRVGLVWAGQSRPWQPGVAGVDRRRSMPFAALAPLMALPGVSAVGLQKGAPAQDGLEDAVAGARDFADTAAVVAGLDVVVSVDTAVAHLAGAMGRPVLLLDRFDACWRWMEGREDSPWYPGLRILRQERPGDWDGVVARAGVALREMAQGRG